MNPTERCREVWLWFGCGTRFENQRIDTSSIQPNSPCAAIRKGFGPTRRGKNRRGLTLIELLVVLAIVGILIALLLPAVMSAREAARRVQCAANLKMIGVAIHQHIEAHRVLPGGFGKPLDSSFLFQILPYLEQESLYHSFNMVHVEVDPNANNTARDVVVSTFLCPSEPSRSWAAKSATNYAANAGRDAIWGEGPFSGVPIAPARITDGLSQTAGVAEWIVGPGDYDRGSRLGSVYAKYLTNPPKDRRAFARLCDQLASDPPPGPFMPFKGRGWEEGGLGMSQYNHTLPPNSPSCGILPWRAVTAGSFHGPGANVLFLDGRVRFVKQSIDPEVWYAVGTRAGGEVVSGDALK